MKSNFRSFVFVVLALGSLASVAEAQNISATFTANSFERSEILWAMCRDNGYNLMFPKGMRTNELGKSNAINLKDTPFQDALDKVMEGSGFQARLDVEKQTVFVSSASSPEQPIAQQPQVQRAVQYQAPVPAAQFQVPVPGVPDFYQMPASEQFRLRRLRPDYDPCEFSDPGCNFGYDSRAFGLGSYGGNSYGYGFYNPLLIRDFSNQEKFGLLKIDGPERFLQQVRVVVDGRDLGVGSKANSWWNDSIILPSGSHVVEFVRESKTILAFRREVDIVPLSVQFSILGKRTPTQLRVSGNEFENARDVYEYKQHRFAEK